MSFTRTDFVQRRTTFQESRNSYVLNFSEISNLNNQNSSSQQSREPRIPICFIFRNMAQDCTVQISSSCSQLFSNPTTLMFEISETILVLFEPYCFSALLKGDFSLILAGIKFNTFHGHFMLRNSDLLMLPAVDVDKAFAMQLILEETLLTTPTVFFQAALLYPLPKR